MKSTMTLLQKAQDTLLETAQEQIERIEALEARLTQLEALADEIEVLRAKLADAEMMRDDAITLVGVQRKTIDALKAELSRLLGWRDVEVDEDGNGPALYVAE